MRAWLVDERIQPWPCLWRRCPKTKYFSRRSKSDYRKPRRNRQSPANRSARRDDRGKSDKSTPEKLSCLIWEHSCRGAHSKVGWLTETQNWSKSLQRGISFWTFVILSNVYTRLSHSTRGSIRAKRILHTVFRSPWWQGVHNVISSSLSWLAGICLVNLETCLIKTLSLMGKFRASSAARAQ